MRRRLSPWDDLLRNRTGELTHEEVQALSSSTVFKARLQHHQLDLQLFVTDEKAGAVLSATAWHAALEAVLRRRIRRTFNLDVFLVLDYGARHTHPASQRQQSLSEDSGMAVQAQAPEKTGRVEQLAVHTPEQGERPARQTPESAQDGAKTAWENTHPLPATTNSGA
ncbi:hypothetical protein [Streptomyces galbus]|uniref:DUF721 domain-containing protein n=1 Tax=Streptomyces galbus TaxID=33898 RepID=A0ABX1IUN6_STRGB|nr:hypothetical protein [Streptomyces galbus]NKQ27902.1 hypothetical protein [Streptomyces galbus]